MGTQITASKTDLFLACQRPFAEGTEIGPREPTEAMRYGSCIHGLLERLIKGGVSAGAATEWCARWGVTGVSGALIHAGRALAAIENWATKNQFGLQFRIESCEVPQATSLKPLRSRDCGFDEATHHYDLAAHEAIGGSYDVLLVSEGNEMAVVLDLKTGDYGVWTEPAKLGQMLTLVLQTRANPRWKKYRRWGAAILHAPLGGIFICFADEVEGSALKAHHETLLAKSARVGDGSLTPGPQCMRCPAREGCPANDGALLARSGAIVKRSAAELTNEGITPGALHMAIPQLEGLLKRAREALRTAVENGEVIVRPDGKTLELRDYEVERGLSKKGILTGLGKERGEALLDELRALGVLVERKEKRLIAVDGDK